MAIKDPKRTVICADCGREIVIPYTTYTYNRRNNKPFRCKECSRLFKSKQTKDWWNSLSDEEKQKWSEQSKQNQANLSDEVKERRSKILSESKKKFWANASEETKERIASKRDEGFKKWYEANPSEASEILANSARMLWDNMNEEGREEKVKSLHAGHKAWFDSLTDQEREEFGMKHSQISKEHWGKISKRERAEIIRKVIDASRGRNKLHQRFESKFNSEISHKYRYIPEYKLENNNHTHTWDYVIFDDENNAVAAVDLDGAFFHSDIADYDAHMFILDKTRGYSVPINTKIFIIRELEFDIDWEQFKNGLKLTADEWVDYRFKYLRCIPFPNISYPDLLLMRSYRRLSTADVEENTANRLGDMIVYNFHHSIWNDNGIYKKWMDDEQLLKWIRTGVVYNTHLHKNKLLIGLWPNTISAGQYKLILSKYLKNDQFVYDPGMDPSLILALIVTQRPIHRPERNETIAMIDFLVKYGVKVECTNTIGTILTTVENDEEMKEIMAKYNASKYAFLVKETSMGAVTDIGIYGHKLVIIKK